MARQLNVTAKDGQTPFLDRVCAFVSDLLKKGIEAKEHDHPNSWETAVKVEESFYIGAVNPRNVGPVILTIREHCVVDAFELSAAIRKQFPECNVTMVTQ